jgi:hypothetical protein
MTLNFVAKNIRISKAHGLYKEKARIPSGSGLCQNKKAS